MFRLGDGNLNDKLNTNICFNAGRLEDIYIKIGI